MKEDRNRHGIRVLKVRRTYVKAKPAKYASMGEKEEKKRSEWLPFAEWEEYADRHNP